tara:strand:- start:44025 stop:44216 length:192 start_codon:yes stop_codon:yes gene_type:complete
MSDYKTMNHAKFLIAYHIIFVVKYRKRLLDQYGDIIKQLVLTIAKQSSFDISKMEVDIYDVSR